MTSFKVFVSALFAIVVISGFFVLYDSDDGINYDSNNIIITNETYDTPSFSFLTSLKAVSNIETGNDFIDEMTFKFISGVMLIGLLYYLRSGN